MAAISRNTCPMAASSGFYQSPGPPPSGNVRVIVLAHHHGHQNGQQSWCIFSSLFCLLSSWQPPGQYGESSHPMVASSGFWDSPGHAALGYAICIAPTHPLSWVCWQHVGNTSATCQNAANFGLTCVSVPTPKSPRHKNFESEITNIL
jgi:hypothetical protein